MNVARTQGTQEQRTVPFADLAPDPDDDAPAFAPHRFRGTLSLHAGHWRPGADLWGKPGVPQYEPLGHTPLLVHWPGAAGGGTCEALTTGVDLHATLAAVGPRSVAKSVG